MDCRGRHALGPDLPEHTPHQVREALYRRVLGWGGDCERYRVSIAEHQRATDAACGTPSGRTRRRSGIAGSPCVNQRKVAPVHDIRKVLSDGGRTGQDIVPG